MKKISLFLLLLLLILAGSVYFFKFHPVSTSIPLHSGKKTATNRTINRKSGRPLTLPLSVPDGYHIGVYAEGLGQARDMEFSPGGTLLVSNPAASEVYALPDADNNGVTDTRKIVVSGRTKIHGLAFHNGQLYIAEMNKVVRYNWDEKTLTATFDKQLFTIPGTTDHILRTIVFNGNQMYVSVGSNCNVCEEPNDWNGSVITAGENGENPHIYSSGLRNAPFLAVNPLSKQVWVTEMGRDYLGDNLPPDEINILQDKKSYGWPLCYGDNIHDTDFDKRNYFKDPCTTDVPPIYEIPAHSAPLGLAFIESAQFPSNWQNDLFVAYHGSWNRTSPIGYKVVRLTVKGNKITNSEDFLTGFLQGRTVYGRPVDVIFDRGGNLYVSDDKNGLIYVISKLK